MKLPVRNLPKKLVKITHFLSKPIYLALAILLLCSHNLYIKMDTYFLQPDQEATLSLYNGTFEESENIITRDRMQDASIVAHGKRTAIKAAQWKDKDSTVTQLTFNTGKAGTYVAGVSTKARNIELTAEKFNSYLKHDGVIDMLAKRTKDSLLDQDAVESYQKHVKAIYQVGDTKTDDWNTVLGYPIEFVPQANPYETYSGQSLNLKVLLDGKPLANQIVYADYIKTGHSHTESHTHDGETHSHDEETHTHDGEVHSHDDKEHSHDEETHSHDGDDAEDHTHTSSQQTRTNAEGLVTIDLPEEGIYYIRAIHMTEVTDSDELTHQSKWATLTFEVGHEHGEDTHIHDHGLVVEDGIPMWVFIVGSLLVIVLLFFMFRKKN